MSHLVPCPDCARHVRTHEAACPFCGTALDLAHLPPPPMPTRRLGRKALFAFGATVAASMAVTACGGDDEGGSKGTGGTTSTGGAGGSGGGSGGSSTGGSGGSATGGSGGIVDAGSDTGSGGANTGGTAGVNAGGTAGIAPPYGIPPDA